MVKAPPLFAAAIVVAGIAATAPEAFPPPPPPPIGGVDAPLASEVGDSGCWAATRDLSDTAAVETEEKHAGGAKAAAAPTGMRTSAPPSSVPPSPPMSH